MPIEDGQLTPEEWKGTVVETALPVVDSKGNSEGANAADVITIYIVLRSIDYYRTIFRVMIPSSNITMP